VEEMELVERKPEGVRARRELILAFLPWRRTTAQPKAGLGGKAETLKAEIRAEEKQRLGKQKAETGGGKAEKLEC
jgi:hypothetical protein